MIKYKDITEQSFKNYSVNSRNDKKIDNLIDPLSKTSDIRGNQINKFFKSIAPFRNSYHIRMKSRESKTQEQRIVPSYQTITFSD